VKFGSVNVIRYNLHAHTAAADIKEESLANAKVSARQPW